MEQDLCDKCGKNLEDFGHEVLIDNFVNSFHILHEQWGLQYTPKFHIIESHLKFYFRETNKSLGYYTDQLIESINQTIMSKTSKVMFLS